MKLHAQAALTVHQREEARRLHQEQGVSIRTLAKRFGVNPTTIQRWVHRQSPLDLSTAPVRRHTTITPDYRQAVLEARKADPHHGPVTIARELSERFPQANRGTVWRILHDEGKSQPKPPKSGHRKPINVGRHRVQMDIQRLPAIEGGKGFEYKISIIHLRTRLKYSEIHDNYRSSTVAAVLRRALDRLPPLFSS